MAQATAFKTYDAAGNREDLSDVIAIVAAEDAPMYNNFAKVKASATYTEWQTDALAAAAKNANIEGANLSYAVPTATTRLGAYTQIFLKTVKVSGTQEVVDKAGRDSEIAYQKMKRLRELMRDVEYALVNGTGASGATGTARELKGTLAWITTNVTTGTATSTETLIESMFNSNLQECYVSGGKPGHTYANAFQQLKIASFSTPNARTEMIDDGEVSAYVNVYYSQFGRMIIVPDRAMSTDVVANLQNDMWSIAELRPIDYKDTYVDADAVTGRYLGELTLRSHNEKASGKITGLKTS